MITNANECGRERQKHKDITRETNGKSASIEKEGNEERFTGTSSRHLPYRRHTPELSRRLKLSHGNAPRSTSGTSQSARIAYATLRLGTSDLLHSRELCDRQFNAVELVASLAKGVAGKFPHETRGRRLSCFGSAIGSATQTSSQDQPYRGATLTRRTSGYQAAQNAGGKGSCWKHFAPLGSG